MTGATTPLSIAFKPIPATLAPGFSNPYFIPRPSGLPNNVKPAPKAAPSAPYLTLFLILANARSLPDNPSVFSIGIAVDSLSGSDAIKSVAANAVDI